MCRVGKIRKKHFINGVQYARENGFEVLSDKYQ